MVRLGFTKTQTPGNKYTKDWLIVLCEMVLCETKRNEICTLRNENLYFHEELLFSYNHDREFLVSCKRRSQNLGPRKKRKQFFRACLPRNAAAKLALSIVLSPPLLSFLGGPVLLFYAMIT